MRHDGNSWLLFLVFEIREQELFADLGRVCQGQWGVTTDVGESLSLLSDWEGFNILWFITSLGREGCHWFKVSICEDNNCCKMLFFCKILFILQYLLIISLRVYSLFINQMYILKRRAFGISYFFIYVISFNPDNNSVRYVVKYYYSHKTKQNKTKQNRSLAEKITLTKNQNYNSNSSILYSFNHILWW